MRSGRVCGVSQLFIIRAAVVQLLVRSALRLENLHTIIISQLGRLGSTAPNVNAVGLKWRALWALDVRSDPLWAAIGMVGPACLLTPVAANPPSVAVLTVTA